MKANRYVYASLLPAALALCVSGCVTAPRDAGAPSSTLALPEAPADRAYLGLTGAPERITVGDLGSDVVLVHFFDMYCRNCQKGAPAVNGLFDLIEKDGRSNQLKMIGVGVGNTPFEVQTYRGKYKTRYPVFADRNRSVYNALAGTRIPGLIALRRGPDGSMKEFFRHNSYFMDPGPILGRIDRRLK